MNGGGVEKYNGLMSRGVGVRGKGKNFSVPRYIKKEGDSVRVPTSSEKYGDLKFEFFVCILKLAI
jgi:hypothetical protein